MIPQASPNDTTLVLRRTFLAGTHTCVPRPGSRQGVGVLVETWWYDHDGGVRSTYALVGPSVSI